MPRQTIITSDGEHEFQRAEVQESAQLAGDAQVPSENAFSLKKSVEFCLILVAMCCLDLAKASEPETL